MAKILEIRPVLLSVGAIVAVGMGANVGAEPGLTVGVGGVGVVSSVDFVVGPLKMSSLKKYKAAATPPNTNRTKKRMNPFFLDGFALFSSLSELAILQLLLKIRTGLFFR